MKKLFLYLLLSFSCLTSYSISYWQPYPLTAQVTSNGSQWRMECSVYDSLLQSTQYYYSPYYDSISIAFNTDGMVGFRTYQLNSGCNCMHHDSIYGYIIYDQELVQFKTHLESFYHPNDNPQVFFYRCQGMILRYTEFLSAPQPYSIVGPSPWGDYSVSTYDIINHSWQTSTLIDDSWIWGGFKSNAIAYAFGGDNNDGIISMYDPGLHVFRNELRACSTPDAFEDDFGVISGQTMCDGDITFYSYDPLSNTFKSFNNFYPYLYFGGTDQWSNGIFYTFNYNSSETFIGTYDGILQQWKIDSTVNSISNVVVKDRVVAYTDTVNSQAMVYYQAYSPTLHQWVKDSSASAGIDTLFIQDGTVNWTDGNSVAHFAGYNDTTGWGNFNTPLFLYFQLTDLSSVTGEPLIHVRNYSIGTDSVWYDFGDGILTKPIDNQRTLWHLYKINNHYGTGPGTINANVCIYSNSSSGVQSWCDSISHNFCLASGTASLNIDTICSGDSVSFSLTGFIGNIQWQHLDAGNWVNDTLPGFNAPGFSMVFTDTSYQVDVIYRAMIFDSLCVPAYSNQVQVHVNPYPSSGSPSVSPDTICTGSYAYLFASGASGNSFQWQKFSGTNWINSSYSVSPTVTTQYRLIVTSGNCGSDTSAAITLTVITLPVAPVITPSGSTTFCLGSSVMLTANYATNLIYQFNRNGIPIPGANAPGYSATIAGAYTVTLSGPNCSTTTPAVVVTVPCMPAPPDIAREAGQEGSEPIRVYPNPASEKLFVSFPDGYAEKTSVQLFNSIGENVFEQNDFIPSAVFEIDMKSLSEGIYLLSISGKETVYFKVTRLQGK